MVFINEWFPNPPGVDTGQEFIELYNSGASTVDLNGWTLATEKGKTFSLTGRVIAARGLFVLTHADTKLTLRNTDGGLSLYNASGLLADRASFAGAAPTGLSFSRVDYGAAPITHFAFEDPTPGAANTIPRITLTVRAYPTGVALNAASAGLNAADFFAIMMGTAALIAGLIAYIAKSHEDLSHFFFGRDDEAW